MDYNTPSGGIMGLGSGLMTQIGETPDFILADSLRPFAIVVSWLESHPQMI